MKKLRRSIATFTLGATLMFGAGASVGVRADQTSGGPQGRPLANQVAHLPVQAP